MMTDNNEKLLPCPFCGNSEFEMMDTLYPSGITWQFSLEAGCKRYGGHREYENVCWKISCKCDTEVNGDSKEETIKLWNTRHHTKQSIIQSCIDEVKDFHGSINELDLIRKLEDMRDE